MAGHGELIVAYIGVALALLFYSPPAPSMPPSNKACGFR